MRYAPVVPHPESIAAQAAYADSRFTASVCVLSVYLPSRFGLDGPVRPGGSDGLVTFKNKQSTHTYWGPAPSQGLIFSRCICRCSSLTRRMRARLRVPLHILLLHTQVSR